jgi:COP9 signalosome complex subunit 3
MDIITYYHHAGLICAATGNYTKAVEMFTIVSSYNKIKYQAELFQAVSIPTNVASATQLISAKRAILCELLVSGKVSNLVGDIGIPLTE